MSLPSPCWRTTRRSSTSPQTAQQIALGRKVGAEIAEDLVDDIAAMGLPAQRGTSESVFDPGDLVIRGTLISYDAGSAVERIAIGFGEGNAELKTAVEGFLVTDSGLRKLGSGSIDSGDSKTPGAAVPLAIAIASGNPIGLIVSTGVKLHAEETGESTIEGKAKETAAEIAKADQAALPGPGLDSAVELKPVLRIGVRTMSQDTDTSQAYLVVSGASFGLIAVIHLVRATKGWGMAFGPLTIPLWESWTAFIVTTGLCLWAIRLATM